MEANGKRPTSSDLDTGSNDETTRTSATTTSKPVVRRPEDTTHVCSPCARQWGCPTSSTSASQNRYTERFGSRDAPARGGEHTDLSGRFQQPSEVNPIASHASALVAKSAQHVEVPTQEDKECAADKAPNDSQVAATSTPVSVSVVADASLSALSGAEELMRRRFQLPSEESDSSATSAGAAMPSAEDLMRRRFLVSQESSVDAAAAVMADSNQDEEVGPSRPPVGASYEMYEQAYGASDEGDEEDEDCEDVYVEQDRATDSSANHIDEETSDDLDSTPLALLERFKMPVLNLSMSLGPTGPSSSSGSGAASSSLMSLLGGYGDDDEEEKEEEEEEEEEEEVEETVVELKVSSQPVPTLVPQFASRVAVPIVSVRSSTLPTTELNVTWPSVSLPSKAFQHPSVTVNSSNNNSVSSASGYRLVDVALSTPLAQGVVSSSAGGLLKGPRIVKTDSAVTALVPNVLKAKRQLQRQQQGLPTAKAVKTVHAAPVPSIATATPSSVSAGGSSLEDAYNSFLSEIGELGGLDE
eukprot:gene21737-27791_t